MATAKSEPLSFIKGMTMKKILPWSVLGVMLWVNTSWAQTNTSSSATEEAVAALEQKWLKSQQTNNPELLAPLLAENFVQTLSDGKVTTSKDAALADAKTTRWTSAEYSDLKVIAFGNAAIAIGRFRGKGTDASGKALDENERFTDTWLKMPGGKWQCIASQVTAIKK